MIKKSSYEEKISTILKRWQIEFEFQKKFKGCVIIGGTKYINLYIFI